MATLWRWRHKTAAAKVARRARYLAPLAIAASPAVSPQSPPASRPGLPVRTPRVAPASPIGNPAPEAPSTGQALTLGAVLPGPSLALLASPAAPTSTPQERLSSAASPVRPKPLGLPPPGAGVVPPALPSSHRRLRGADAAAPPPGTEAPASRSGRRGWRRELRSRRRRMARR
eukprot:scaffold259_cov252-Pinguiococcus_pyrenoidosus.AAC.23